MSAVQEVFLGTITFKIPRPVNAVFSFDVHTSSAFEAFLPGIREEICFSVFQENSEANGS